MKQFYSKIIQKKKEISIVLVLALMFGVFPINFAKVTEVKAAGSEYGISNPRTDSDGVATWDCIYFGNYWQNDTNGDGKADKNDEKQPIKWRVLSVEGDDAFLLADQNLDCQPYNDEYINVTWETCTLRQWLNSDFYQDAFDNSEQSAVWTTTVVNEDNWYYETEGGNNTNDNVYLLSIDEARDTVYGFHGSKTRKAKNTEYIEKYGEYISSNTGDGMWWLRSPGCNSNDAACVDFSGDVDYDGVDVDAIIHAVRPALHLNLSSSKWSKAGTVSSSGAGSAEVMPNPTSTPMQKVNFQLGKDNNSFIHNWYKEGYSGAEGDYYCPSGNNYAVQRIEYIRKLADGSNEQYKMLLEQMNKEWNGSCYGISLAMLLNKNQSVDLDYLGVDDFYDIKPYTNVKARSFMNYLYLSQFSSAYSSTKLFGADTYKQGFLQRLLGMGKSKDSLKEFLEKFVTEIQNNQNTNGLPVEFLYSKKSQNGVSGHCILATGISHEGSEYVVDLYDMNTVLPYQCGKPATMTISDDYSSFIYNGLESKYIELAYLDTQKVLDAHFEDYDDFSKRIKNIESERTGVLGTAMYLNPGVTIMNGVGKRILYDDEGMSGDMVVHDIAPIYGETVGESADSQLAVFAEESEEYEISSEGDMNVSICDSNQFMSLSGKNIDLVTTDLGKTTVKGNSASYQLSIDSPMQDCDVLCISADSDETTYRYDADKLLIESETGISNVEISALNRIEKKQQNIELTANRIEIYNDLESERKLTVLASNENGEIEKKTIGVETESPSASEAPGEIPSPTPSINDTTIMSTTSPKTTTPSYKKTISQKLKKPGKVTGVYLYAKKGRKIEVEWTSLYNNTSGYQIQYAQNKGFSKKKKTKNVAGYLKWFKTIKGLKKGKIYYVRVRAYNKKAGKKVYGKWSKVKKIKIKK